MKNFYFVLSFNVTNPIVKKMIKRQGIFTSCDQMVDFKIRSRPYMSFTEATIACHYDYKNKQDAIYTEKEEHPVRHICVLNPAFVVPVDDLEAQIAEKFGHAALNGWSDNCAAVLFFAEADFADESNSEFSPNSWMLKYEVLSFDDAIELSGNGDFVFSPMHVARDFSSALH